MDAFIHEGLWEAQAYVTQSGDDPVVLRAVTTGEAVRASCQDLQRV